MRLIDPIELKRAISVAAMSNNHKTLEQIIDEQPTIEERKKGEWIKMPYHVTECSECGFSLEDWIQGAFYNFCPHCGADMRGDAMSVKKEVLAGLIACDVSKVNCPNCIYSRPFCGEAVTCGFWDCIEILHPDDFCSFFTLKEE